jgi:hypothetical protein
MGTFKHNKKRNSGLIYEFLVRHVSKCMIDNDTSGYQKSLIVIRKYFGDGAPLAEERELFDVVRTTRGVTENAARRILGEIQRAANQSDVKKIEIKKSNLIKEINYGFGQNFWDSYRVPEYRLLATIQMVIDAARGKHNLTESVQNIQLEEGLVKYMTSNKEFSSQQQPREDIDQLVMAMTAKKFHEKYSVSLRPNQKVLLEKFMRSQVTGDNMPLANYLHSEMERIVSSMKKARLIKEIIEDQEMLKKLDEALEKFPKECGRDAVEAVMVYQNLVEELESNG